MKSGTNWLGSLLSSHEQISCVGEFHWQDIMAKFNANLLELPLFEDDEYQRTGSLSFGRDDSQLPG